MTDHFPPPPPPPPRPGSAPSYGSQPQYSPAATGGQSRSLRTGGQVHLASAWERLGARVIDVAVIVAAFFVLAVIIGIGTLSLSNADEDSTSISAVATLGLIAMLLAIGILYEVVLIAVKGQTLGKMAVGIKVVRASSGGVPGGLKSFTRWIVPSIPALVPVVGQLIALLVYCSLLWDDRRQGWHDKAAKTLVVKAN